MWSTLLCLPRHVSHLRARAVPVTQIIAAPVGLALMLAAGVAGKGTSMAQEPLVTAPPSPEPAARQASLPTLQNTESTDRLFLREIGDDHVFVIDSDVSDTARAGALQNDPPSTAPLDVTTPASDSSDAAPVAYALGDDAGERLDTDAARQLFTFDDSAEQAAPVDAWERIRASDRLPISEHSAVQSYREQYVREAMWVDRILERGNVFITHLVDALDARFLPVELALLPAIESGFRPEVLSRGQAAGLWQIVPITAREIGLERTAWFDGRADTVASTTAALDYLSYLSAEFHGDWELTLAAYNAGPGRVRRAIRRNEKADKPTDFWSLPLPEETRDYVPKMLALVSLLKDESPILKVPGAGAAAGFEQVDVGLRISLDKAAQLSGVDETELKRLNAGLLHAVTGPKGPHALYLPAGTSQAFLARLAAADKSELFSLPASHAVVSGDTLSGIAHRYGMSQRRLMDLNALDDARIRIGQTLAVVDIRGSAKTDIEYVVTIGDTLSAIAQRHSVKRAAIRDADGKTLSDDLIHPGETLMISVPLGNAG